MRAFVTPSIILSVARRSRGFTHVFGGSFDDDARFQSVRNSLSTRVMTSTALGEGPARATPEASTLGLDPDNCTAAEIRHKLRRSPEFIGSCNRVPMASVIPQGSSSNGCCLFRGYNVGKRTKAQLLGELRDLVRAETFAPPEPSGISEDSEAQRRWSSDAGWVNPAGLERGPGGNALCRFCNQEIPSNRRTFCSNPCVHEHKIRTQGAYVRKSVLYRDGGKCAECGTDAHGLYRRAREAWAARDSAEERREAMAREMVGTPFEGKVPREGSTKKPTSGLFWHADHIVPVVRGGGQCSLNNYRTLCVPCHAEVTKRLAGERAAERARAWGAGASDSFDSGRGGERRDSRKKGGRRAQGGRSGGNRRDSSKGDVSRWQEEGEQDGSVSTGGRRGIDVPRASERVLTPSREENE